MVLNQKVRCELHPSHPELRPSFNSRWQGGAHTPCNTTWCKAANDANGRAEELSLARLLASFAAKNSYPTICGINSPATSVKRMSRPLYRYVSLVCSMLSKARIVACKS